MASRIIPLVEGDLTLRWSVADRQWAAAHVVAHIPAAEEVKESFHASLFDFDEGNCFLQDVHNAWRSWGSLVEHPLYDLYNIQQKFPF